METDHPNLNKLDQQMQQYTANNRCEPDFLYNMIEYHLGWLDKDLKSKTVSRGKRLRPLLLMLCCEAICGEWEQALPAAMAVEFLHNFTLIHDDIEDRDDVRHGRPTLWSIWGIPQAINAGDALYALAYKVLLELPPTRIDNTRIVKAVQIYTDAILRITEGQCLDISFETRQTVSEGPYLTMIEGKTAALFGLSCELGGIIAGADTAHQMHLKNFGVALGMAFQMQDDILGLWGDPNHTGKPVGSDLLKSKKSLPIIHCAQLNAEFLQLTEKSLTKTDLVKAMRLLKKTGSLGYTQNKAQAFFDKALQALDLALSDSSQKKKLLSLVTRLTDRQR